jgi:hypothetical protein
LHVRAGGDDAFVPLWDTVDAHPGTPGQS